MHTQNGIDITTLNLKPMDAITDYLVLCSVDSPKQAEAMAEAIIQATKKINQPPWRQEGRVHRDWIILDYVDAIVHVFLSTTRSFYGLEQRWGDAERL